jgi:hypothetical protein
MAYSDVYLVLIALLANLRMLTQPATVAALARVTQSRFGGLRPAVPSLPQGAMPGAVPGRPLTPYEPRA